MPTSNRLVNLPELERLALAARRVDGGILAVPPPRLPVGGTELSGYRDYAAGDDHRHIDWNVCARHDELRVRQYAGKADCHVRILIDASASMGQGRAATHFAVAVRIAASLGYVALDRQARLSILTFSDRLNHRIGPLRGKGRAARMLGDLERLAPVGGETDFQAAVDAMVRCDQSHGPVVVVSDFCQADAFSSGLSTLRLAGMPLRVVHICPTGDDGVTPGDIELVDVESGQTWQMTLSRRQLRKYHELAAADRERPRLFCQKYRIPYVRVGGGVPDRGVLGEVLRGRSRAW